MSKRYGVPYRGNKTNLADWILESIPAAQTFVDLFAGGGAMTHAAMLSGKFNKALANDADGRGLKVFMGALNGEYTLAKCGKWYSREEFNANKDDPYVSIVWSFASNMKGYLYKRQTEPYKQALWDLCHSDTEEQRGLAYRNCIRKLYEMSESQEILQIKGAYSTLASLEPMERIKTIEGLIGSCDSSKITTSFLDYKDVEIPADSVVYCDPPYGDTNKYKYDIDQDEFVNWCNNQNVPVFVSEFNMNGLHLLKEKSRVSHYSIKNNSEDVVERLYGNDLAKEIFNG